MLVSTNGWYFGVRWFGIDLLVKLNLSCSFYFGLYGCMPRLLKHQLTNPNQHLVIVHTCSYSELVGGDNLHLAGEFAFYFHHPSENSRPVRQASAFPAASTSAGGHRSSQHPERRPSDLAPHPSAQPHRGWLCPRCQPRTRRPKLADVRALVFFSQKIGKW